MSSDKFPDPLQEYFDSLLGDSLRSDVQPGASSRRADETGLKLAAGGNVAALPSAPRSARMVPARPYAEPVRTLNLRMPLPPVAPVTVPVVESAPIVETELRVESQSLQIAPKEIELEQIVAPPKPVVAPEKIMTPAPVTPSAPIAQLAETLLVSEIQGATGLAVMEPPAEWLPNGRPQWAQQPFECLIFKAGGLELAAPLVELGSIYPLEGDGLTAIFGQTQWFMGLLPAKEYNIRTMDTALVVMPERYNAAMREDYRYIVSLFGSDWGLAVDAVVGTVVLDPERIRWRGQRSKRPWLAGTLIDQMCALFDIAQLAWLFHNQDRKRAPA